MNNLSHPIIIIGANHHNTLGVVRAFGEVGMSNYLRLIIVSEGSDFISKSRYIRRNNYRKIDSESEILNALDSFNLFDSKPVIISCSDKVSSFLSLHHNLLSERYIIPNANDLEGEMHRLMDKTTQLEYARSVGIKVPYSQELLREEVDSIKWDVYPCIVKPLESILGEKPDIKICSNRKELYENVSKSSCKKFQIQQYVSKSVEYQLIGCSWGGEVIIPGATRLIRQPNNTNTGYLIYNDKFDFDMTKAVALVNSLGYNGLFSLEFLRGNDGNDYFMEINMRNDGNAYCVTCSGVNLPLIWYKKSLNIPIDESELHVKRTVHFMPELYDVRNIRRIGVYKWLKEFVTAESHACFNIFDPIPFVCQLSNMIKDKIRRAKNNG